MQSNIFFQQSVTTVWIILAFTSFSMSVDGALFKRTVNGTSAVLGDPHHMRLQTVSRLTGCTRLCLHNSQCSEFQYSASSATCIIRHEDQISVDDIGPVSGLFDVYTLYTQELKTCSDVKADDPAARSGEYYIHPAAPQFKGVSVKVYCLMNDTHQMEYVTLPNRNFGLVPNKTNPSCLLEKPGVKKSGTSEYEKIRVNTSTMAVLVYDRTFESGTRFNPTTYGIASDCYSKDMTCKRVGTFHINTLGTGIKFHSSLEWRGTGLGSLLYNRTDQENGAIIDLTCGGFCGDCRPDSAMILHPNSQDIQP